MGFFKSTHKRARREGGKTIIAEGSYFRGEISRLEGGLLIDGTFEGVIESEFDLAVGMHGVVRGLIKARQIIVTGTLEGKVICDHIEILKSGKFMGELLSGEIAIEAGGKFIGKSEEVTGTSAMMAFSDEDKKRITQQPDKVVQIMDSVETVFLQQKPTPE